MLGLSPLWSIEELHGLKQLEEESRKLKRLVEIILLANTVETV